MIVRIDVHHRSGAFGYRVLAEGDVLFEDDGHSSVMLSLASAVEGLAPDVRAVEVACGGIVSGTYALEVLATRPAEIAQHAVNTTAAVFEALGEPPEGFEAS